MNPYINLSEHPNPPLQNTCLIAKDGVPFISVNAAGDMFINRIDGRRGELSPKHGQKYDEFRKLFCDYAEGKIIKQQFLQEIFSKAEISHMNSSGLFNSTTGNVFME